VYSFARSASDRTVPFSRRPQMLHLYYPQCIVRRGNQSFTRHRIRRRPRQHPSLSHSELRRMRAPRSARGSGAGVSFASGESSFFSLSPLSRSSAPSSADGPAGSSRSAHRLALLHDCTRSAAPTARHDSPTVVSRRCRAPVPSADVPHSIKVAEQSRQLAERHHIRGIARDS
jgi:hypothetical protein